MLVICGAPLPSQTFIPIRIATDSFPKIVARVVALDNAGMPQSLGASDITVSDNNSPVQAVVSCEPSSSGRNISLVVAIDASLSMVAAANPTNMDMAKNAARGITQLLTSTADEIALSQIATGSNLLYGLSTNKTGYATSVDAMSARGGMNSARGLTDLPYGALTHLQNARNARALLIITDGASTFDAQSAISTAKTFGVSVYVVCLRSKINADMKMLADSTRGAWMDQIQSVAEAQAAARAFVADAKRLPLCAVAWTTPTSCSLDHAVTLQRGTVVRTTAYTASKSQITYLESSTTGIEYGSVPVGTKSVRSVILTATNGSVNVSGAGTSSTAFQVINAPRFPLTLNSGESLTISVEYSASSDLGIYDKLTISTSSCSPPIVHLHGGNSKAGAVL
jgi:von Willebrand factor type A domain